MTTLTEPETASPSYSNRNTTALLEVAYSSAPRVDRRSSVIRSVKILGRESRNGRIYSDAALQQAARIYEGLGVNVDHPEKPNAPTDRRFADRFGFLENIETRPDGVYGDLVFLKTHALAEHICEAAERMPTQLGLSHNADGYVVRRGDQTIVESIARVHSVDIVQTPATCRGLFESESGASGVQTSTQQTDEIEQLRVQVRRLESEQTAVRLLEAAGVPVDDVKVSALATLDDFARQEALVASWKIPAYAKPRSSAPISESYRTRSLPADGKSFARAIR